MALNPKNDNHASQIKAGTTGRAKGHQFESELCDRINNLSSWPASDTPTLTGVFFDKNDPIMIDNNIASDCHVVRVGEMFFCKPEVVLIKKCLSVLQWDSCSSVKAYCLGGLATGKKSQSVTIEGVEVVASKSDIVLSLKKGDKSELVGVSAKQCNNYKPTNPQLFLTTATAFCELLKSNDIKVTEDQLQSLQEFCGNDEFKPESTDFKDEKHARESNNMARFYWEETHKDGLDNWRQLFQKNQNEITRLLLQKAYKNDPFEPRVVFQKTRKVKFGPDEHAVYSVDELVAKSANHKKYHETEHQETSKSKSFVVQKGLKHQCPKFGIVQMQRFGNKQNPTQLQFNLQAGYFYLDNF